MSSLLLLLMITHLSKRYLTLVVWMQKTRSTRIKAMWMLLIIFSIKLLVIYINLWKW
jgi:hypothetical protein